MLFDDYRSRFGFLTVLDDEDDDEEVDEEKQAENETRPEDFRDQRQRMKFEHCQIRPCTIKTKLNPSMLPGSYCIVKAEVQHRPVSR